MCKAIKKIFSKILTLLLVVSFFSPLKSYAVYFEGGTIGEYIKSIYIYSISIVGILATVVIMIGGLIWITSMGNAARVANAKDWIGAALTGLALAMFSYVLLSIINEDLVKFKGIHPESIEAQGPTYEDTNAEIYHSLAICEEHCPPPDHQCEPAPAGGFMCIAIYTNTEPIDQSDCSLYPPNSFERALCEENNPPQTNYYQSLGENCNETTFLCDPNIGLSCINGICRY